MVEGQAPVLTPAELFSEGLVELEPLMQVTEADLMQAIAYPLPIRVIGRCWGFRTQWGPGSSHVRK